MSARNVLALAWQRLPAPATTFFFALLLRVSFAATHPPGVWPDSLAYFENGTQFWQTGFIESHAMMPLYPAFIALASWNGAILVQLLLSAATSLIAYALTREFSGDEVAARVCALLVAMNPALIFYSNQPLTETLYAFVLLSSLWLLYLQRYWAGSAALVASVLVRPTLDLLAPLLVVSFIVVRGGAGIVRGAARALAVYAFVYAAMMAPWWLHNYAKYDRFVRLNLGDGMVARVEHNPVFASAGFDWRRLAPVIHSHDDLDPLARNEAYRDEAVQFILEDPLRYARMCVARFFRYWSPTLDQGERFAPLHVNAAAVPMNLFLLVGALLYAWKHLRHEWRRALPFVLLIGYFTAVHSASHALPRYRVPIIPVLALLTSLALARAARDQLKGPPRSVPGAPSQEPVATTKNSTARGPG